MCGTATTTANTRSTPGECGCSIAWLAGCRWLRIRHDRDSERFFAFAMLACARLGYNRWACTAGTHARSP
jgi:hypothetical protein